MARPYKNILALDGGGSWALIQAMALDALYPGEYGHQILRRYDLAIANSGGSLVLGALAINLRPKDFLDNVFMVEEERRKLFSAKILKFLTSHSIGPRYKTSAKLDGLREVFDRGHAFGDTPMENLGTGVDGFPDIVITSLDYDRQRSAFFRSNKMSNASSSPGVGAGPTLAEAMHASSTAPVNYFDKPAEFGSPGYEGYRFWDGGTAGLNNPVLAGVIEAIANGSDPSNLNILSIGTASVMLPTADDFVQPPLAVDKGSPCVVNDIKKLARTILDDPPDAASYMAHRVLHGTANNPDKPRLIRMNPLIQPIVKAGRWDYPDTLDKDTFKQLVKLDMDAVEQPQVELIYKFCDLWLQGKVPNQPIQSDGQLRCHIGQPWFSDADKARKALGL